MAGDFILQVADKKMVKEVLTSSMIVYFLYCKRIKFQNRTVLKNLLKKKHYLSVKWHNIAIYCAIMNLFGLN